MDLTKGHVSKYLNTYTSLESIGLGIGSPIPFMDKELEIHLPSNGMFRLTLE